MYYQRANLIRAIEAGGAVARGLASAVCGSATYPDPK